MLKAKEEETVFKVYFPDNYDRVKQIKTLFKIEQKAIAAVKERILADIKQLTPFQWDTKETREEKRRVVEESNTRLRQWESEARKEAKSGSNWSQDDKNSSTYTYQNKKPHTGSAYEQLKHIDLKGWGRM